MKKKMDREKLFMTVLMSALGVIFVVMFTYGLSSVLAMEGAYPPNILEEGLTPAPTDKTQALDFLNKSVEGAIAGKPKLDTADNFDVNADTLETSGSEQLKNAMIYAIGDFDSQLDSNFQSISTDFGEEIADKLNIPAITAQDIVDFTCEYVYYQCPSCGEENAEALTECELCGSINPYNKKYRDEYTVTLTVASNENTLGGNFNQRTPEEAKALCGDALNGLVDIKKFDISYEELKIAYRVERMTNQLTYLDYSKKMNVNAGVEFLDKYASLGNVDLTFEINENNSYSFTWAGISLSAHEMTIEPKGTSNLLATLTCTDPKAPAVTWSSSDESILTVDEEGYFKGGKEAGEAVITASFEFNGNTYTDECLVKVKYSVEASKMKDKKIALAVGEAKALEVVVSPDNATIKTVKWYSEDESIAAVDENGVVTAVSAGEVTVYSLTDDGYYKSSCEVTVR